MLSTPVSVRMDGDVAWVEIDSPPVNATSTAVRAGLMSAIEQVQGARVAVLICAGKTWVAGGDMSEFDRPAEEPHLPDVVQALEDSSTPFVAAMHGTVLGGGFEIAMGCAWRIAAACTRFGLPEVNVGLIPGAGGTQRAPRLVGMEAAIDLACRGKMIEASTMLGYGGVDVVAEDVRAAATEFVTSLPERPKAVSERDVPPIEAQILEETKASLQAKSKGQKSPLETLKALCWAMEPFAKGQPKERALHLALRQSEESRALRYAFFAERAVARPDAISGAKARAVSNVAVVGGGLMGAGIAWACLNAGLSVVLIERDAEQVQAAESRVAALGQGALKRGKLDAAGLEATLARFNATADYADAAKVDLAIEAVFEDLDAKRAVFAQLDAALGPDAILATNTSYLDPELIFEGISNPARCVGLHFFSPAHIMKLLEIVRTPATSAEVLATGFALGKRLRKVSVLSGICDGFIGNRMLAAYRREMEYLLADGALPHEVDAAMRAAGYPMGPCELQDLTGLQIAWANRKRQAADRPEEERYFDLFDDLCAAGRLGQRAGNGWYRYDAGDRTPKRDPEVEEMIVAWSAKHGIIRRSFSMEEIQTRILAVLANEGARIVEEGIAERAEDVDMVQIHGYGFPRRRGGVMHLAAERGWDHVGATMRQVAEESPKSWVLSKAAEDN